MEEQQAGFAKIFEQRYEGDVYQKAYGQAEEKSQAIIVSPEDKVGSVQAGEV